MSSNSASERQMKCITIFLRLIEIQYLSSAYKNIKDLLYMKIRKLGLRKFILRKLGLPVAYIACRIWAVCVCLNYTIVL